MLAKEKELIEKMRGELDLKRGEKIAAMSKNKYGNANIDWDSVLTITNKRLIMRPRRGYDAKRRSGIYGETIVSDECFREMLLSKINYMSRTRYNVAIGSTDGQEIKLDLTFSSNKKEILEAIAMEGELEKITQPSKKEKAARGVGATVVAGFGILTGIFGVLIGIVIILVGVLLCLTIIGAIIGIPLMIFGSVIVIGALGIAGIGVMGGGVVLKSKEEWRRREKRIKEVSRRKKRKKNK